MNVRRGLLRLWLFASAIWLISWAAYVWLSRIEAVEDATGQPFVAFHTDFGKGWTAASEFALGDYLSLAAIGVGIPLANLDTWMWRLVGSRWLQKQLVAAVGWRPFNSIGHEAASVNVIGKGSSLADSHAAHPKTAAAAAAAAAAPAAAAAAATATSATPAASATAASAASAASGKSFPNSGRSGVFLVEDVERPQADVGDFFLTENDLGRGGIPRQYIRRWHSGCRRCAARQRQRHAGDTYYRYRFPSRP